MVADDLRSLAKEGLSLLEIARGIQTARGCQWGAEGVGRALAQAVPWDEMRIWDRMYEVT